MIFSNVSGHGRDICIKLEGKQFQGDQTHYRSVTTRILFTELGCLSNLKLVNCITVYLIIEIKKLLTRLSVCKINI
jgi:hypothetical protein